MAGFGRREIEHMQALCIYNRYIECYSVVLPFIKIAGSYKDITKEFDIRTFSYI